MANLRLDLFAKGETTMFVDYNYKESGGITYFTKCELPFTDRELKELGYEEYINDKKINKELLKAVNNNFKDYENCKSAKQFEVKLYEICGIKKQEEKTGLDKLDTYKDEVKPGEKNSKGKEEER